MVFFLESFCIFLYSILRSGCRHGAHQVNTTIYYLKFYKGCSFLLVNVVIGCVFWLAGRCNWPNEWKGWQARMGLDIYSSNLYTNCFREMILIGLYRRAYLPLSLAWYLFPSFLGQPKKCVSWRQRNRYMLFPPWNAQVLCRRMMEKTALAGLKSLDRPNPHTCGYLPSSSSSVVTRIHCQFYLDWW